MRALPGGKHYHFFFIMISRRYKLGIMVKMLNKQSKHFEKANKGAFNYTRRNHGGFYVSS